MARPKKLVGKKTAHIDVRLSAEEKQHVVQSANEAGLFIADFVRGKLLKAHAPRTKKATPEREAYLKGMAELSKVGSNINQIAKVLNTHKDSPFSSGVTAGQIASSLDGVDQLSRRILKTLTDGN
jgi:hypothetical protein